MTADDLKSRLSDMQYGLVATVLNVLGCSLSIASVLADAPGRPLLAAALNVFGMGGAFAALCIGLLGIAGDEKRVAAVLSVIVSAVFLFFMFRPALAQ